MKITVIGAPESEALGKAVQRAVDFRGPDATVEIICSDRSTGRREPAGWLEYLISFKNNAGVQDYLIAMIQREPGATYEFHS
jgi:hypothetical protein